MTPGIVQIQQILERTQFLPSKIFTSLGSAIAVTETFEYRYVGVTLDSVSFTAHIQPISETLSLVRGVDMHLCSQEFEVSWKTE